MLGDISVITPVVLHDDDGYWLASHNLATGELRVVGFNYEETYPLVTTGHKMVMFLRASGSDCQGFWEGFVGDEVCRRWNREPSLQDYDGNPIGGAETIALELLIAEQHDFLEKNCEFVVWPGEDSM
jgi:hypothetical protein